MSSVGLLNIIDKGDHISMIVTATEAARQLGMSQQLFSHHIKRGTVTVRRAGGSLLVEMEQVRQELEADGFFMRRKIREARANNRALQTAS